MKNIIRTLLKVVVKIVVIGAILLAGFAAGLPVGQSIGFTKGSEWALVQAELVAREAGLYMPVSYDGERFLVVMKQPNRLYKRAWKLSNLSEEERSHDHTY